MPFSQLRSLGFSDRRHLVAFLLSSLASLITAGLLLFSVVLLTEGVNRRSGARELRGTLDHLLTALSESESKQRGFLLTGNQDFLRDFWQAERQTEAAFNDLQKLVEPNREQVSRLDRLRRMVAAKFDEFHVGIDLKRASQGGMLEIFVTGTSRVDTDTIHDLISTMAAEDERRIADEIIKPARLVAFLVGVIVLAGVAVPVVIYGTMRRLDRLHDVERVRIEELARTKIELETALIARSNFLANMSHELRTPLNAVIGFSDALLGNFFGILNAKQREYLADIRSAGAHLLDLINDILNFSKAEAGAVDIAEDPVDLADVVDEVARLQRVSVDSAGLTLLRQVQPHLPRIMGDRRAIKQILLNLLSNAIKFTPHGGTVTLKAELCPPGEDGIVMSVSDTGIGIDPAFHEKVFEPFRQLTNPMVSQRQGSGTGLGLAIVRSLISAHGGRVELASHPGKGTTVAIVLPSWRILGVEEVAIQPVGNA